MLGDGSVRALCDADVQWRYRRYHRGAAGARCCAFRLSVSPTAFFSSLAYLLRITSVLALYSLSKILLLPDFLPLVSLLVLKAFVSL